MRKTLGNRKFNLVLVETLESRCLLSAALVDTTVIEPDSKGKVMDVTATPKGYTPAQIKTAYGIDDASGNDLVSFTSGSGTVAGNGSGQTIAIVDAYNDPNIAADLSHFDAQFGLAQFGLTGPKLTVVSQTGSSKLPRTNGDWSLEISLDVEWAHAIAPGANILLVEANSESTTDLMAAVNYARSAAGVSVVSMSWGGSEWSKETTYDSSFTTPSGHGGVTFVSASGDDGSSAGAEWPSSSPNVLSVGGTKLTLTTGGAYSSETGWSDSGGGSSAYEKAPSYQAVAQSSSRRTTPDVAYDANPSTGIAVYCSVADSSGHSGWSEVGGTSAGAPQWSALVAIADQGRALKGLSSLDGGTQTLPGLYATYSAPGSSTFSTYTSTFNDITTGSTSRFVSAAAGYDMVSGLGTPKAVQVVTALVTPGTPATVQSTPTSTPPASNPTPPTNYWPSRPGRGWGGWGRGYRAQTAPTSATRVSFSTVAIAAPAVAPSAAPAILVSPQTSVGVDASLFAAGHKLDPLT